MAEILSHPIPAVIFLLGLLVFVHEFGHFIVGRLCGIAVETFSIGFGPSIVQFTRGGTDYRISWIPLGGYVKFAGAHPAEEVPPDLDGIPFRDAALIKRAAAVMAGPLFNFILAIVAYAILGGAGIERPPASIGGVMENSAAEAAGLKYGDVLVEIEGEPISYWRDIEKIISKSAEKKLAIKVRRGEGIVPLTLTPEKVEITNFLGKRVSIGRAGISLGRLSSVVHVVSKDAPVVNAGLQIGDEIIAIGYSGVFTEVKYYPDMSPLLQEILDKGVPYVQMKVRSSALPGDKESKPGVERSITVSAASLKDVPKGSDYLSLLGLSDAQLTIADAKESLSEHLKKGDRIDSWNGEKIRNIFHLRELLEDNKKQEVTLKVAREFELKDITVSLKPLDVQKPEGKVTIYTFPALFWGQLVDPDYLIEEYSNPFLALKYGFIETIERSGGLAKSVAQLFTGEMPLGALGGPMLIAKVAGDSVKAGWKTFLGSLAMISINLGIINLFPIPVLDGGQLVLMGAEAVRRKPLRESAIENFQKLGFAMVMALVVLATYNDLSRFWKSMLESIVGVFQ